MKKLILSLLSAISLFFSGIGIAGNEGTVFSHESEGLGKVKIFMDTACTNADVKELVELREDFKDYKKATIEYEGKPYVGCAAKIESGFCLIVPELGHVDVDADKFVKEQKI